MAIGSLSVNNKLAIYLLAILAEVIIGLHIAASLPPIFLVALFIIPLLFVLILRPTWGYYLAIVASGFAGVALYTHAMPHVPGAKTLNAHHILILITALGCALYIVQNHRRLESSFLDVPVLVFFAWATITCLWTIDFKASLLQSFRMLTAITFFFLSFQLITTREKLDRLVMVWCILGFMDAILTLLFPQGMRSFGRAWQTQFLVRAEGFVGHPNYLASQLGLSMMLTLGLLYSTKSARLRKFLIFSLVVMVTSAIVTISRGWLASLAVGIIYFFYKLRDVKRLMVCLGIGFLIVAAVISSSSDVRRLIGRRFSPEGRPFIYTLMPYTDPARSVYWRHGLEFFEKTYLRGIGIGGFATLIGEEVPEKAARQLHSLYLTILFELGAIGFFILLWIIYLLAKNLHTFSRSAGGKPYEKMFYGWCAGLVILAINAFVRIDLGTLEMWTFLALGLLMVRLYRDDVTSSAPPALKRG